MRKTLSTFTLALVLVSAQAFSAPVSQSQPQPAPEDLLLAATESDSLSLDAAPDSGGQVPASSPDNNEASELGGDNRQQGVIPDDGVDQDSNLAPPPGAGQSNSEASES